MELLEEETPKKYSVKKTPKTERKTLYVESSEFHKKMDEMMQYIDKTMNTWMVLMTEIKDENTKMNQRISNIEKDIRFLKNRKTEMGNPYHQPTSSIFTGKQTVVEANKILGTKEKGMDFEENESIGLDLDIGKPKAPLEEVIKTKPFNPSVVMNSHSLKESDYSSIHRPIDISKTETMNSSMKMASQYKMVESATIQIPRSQLHQFMQVSATQGSSFQSILQQPNGGSYTSIQQQKHFQQVISKSVSSPELISRPVIEYPRMVQIYRDVKIETFELDETFIRKCMETNHLSGDVKMFQKMYLENVSKEFFPIRHIKKTYQYWLNGHMNDDIGGSYIKNTVARNIEILYMKINTMDYYEGQIELFMNNQDHIGKLSDEKYKDKLLAKICQLVSI